MNPEQIEARNSRLAEMGRRQARDERGRFVANPEVVDPAAYAAANPPVPQPFPDRIEIPGVENQEALSPSARPLAPVPRIVKAGARGAVSGGPIGAAAEAASETAQTALEGAQAPAGGISSFLPGPGAGGYDYAGQAAHRALLAALNSAGRISSRFGG